MAARVQAVEAGWGVYSTGQTYAMPGDTVAGNTIVVLVLHSYPGCPPSVTDSQGNTYTSRGSQPSIFGGNLWVFTAPVGSSAACTLTTSHSCGIVRQVYAVEASGLVSDPYDVQAVASDGSSPADAGPFTTTSDGAFVVAMWNRAGVGISATAVNSPFTLQATPGSSSAFADGVVGAAGSYTPQLTCSASVGYPVYGMAAAFTASAGGGFEFLPVFGQSTRRHVAPLLRR